MKENSTACFQFTCGVLAVVTLFGFTLALPEVIKIGGIFESFDDDREMAFRYAVDRINSDPSILPDSRLSVKIERIKPHSSFHASKSVCSLLKEGAVAIFGPSSLASSALVQSTANALHIPHFETRLEYHRSYGKYTVNLFPDIHVLGKALYELVRSKNWRSFTIVYEQDEEIVKLQELMKLRNQNAVKITLHQYTGEYRYNKLLKDIRKRGETNLVLDVPTQRIKDVMAEAQKAGMITEYHNYVIVSLDFHTLDLSNLQHCRSNISAFRIIDPEHQYYAEEARRWIFGDIRSDRVSKKDSPIKTETALLVDAVNFFARALAKKDFIPASSSKTVSCDSAEVWPYGYDITNAMRSVEMTGLTYHIEIDKTGRRTNFTLDLVELKSKGIVKIGEWNPITNITFSKNYSKGFFDRNENLENITLKVTSIESKPYTMKKRGDHHYGNDRYEGFCVDLIREICRRLKCNFEYKLVDDNNYGKKHRNGSWNGMIGEVVKREADLAIADLTITLEREEAVDFTMPFMNLGISILFKKPTKNAPKLFSFLAPFSFEVWVYVATAYLGVSLLLFVLARISPYEWVSPHPCNPKTEHLENTFSLLNSFWFTIGSLMQQGSDIAPKAISTRTVAALWWFFTLIMISSYTANLAAFLTAERMKSPIESADDLARQNEIQYGCLESGSTRAFFETSKLQPYKRMWTAMQTTQPNVFTRTNAQGVERVKKGNYAFLMESTSIEYHTERDCDLTQIGGLLDSKGYGIATPPGSPYRSIISSEILKLQEEGYLHVLKEKWWKEKGGGLCVDEDKKPSTASELGMPNVGGVFVVLLAGLGMSAVIAVLEFIWKTKKIPRDERNNMNAMDDDDTQKIPSVCQSINRATSNTRMILLEMLYELKDICMCRGSSRPPPNYLNGDPLRSSTDNEFVLHTSASFNTLNGSSQNYTS